MKRGTGLCDFCGNDGNVVVKWARDEGTPFLNSFAVSARNLQWVLEGCDGDFCEK